MKKNQNKSGDNEYITRGFFVDHLEMRLDETKEEMKEEMRVQTAKILQGVDKILVRFDKAEKDHTADKLLHDRHEKRIERIETRLEIKGTV